MNLRDDNRLDPTRRNDHQLSIAGTDPFFDPFSIFWRS